ncbi:MAG: hypothetical protein CVV44_06315 [Spirochaetae bacterium HGW-Spirochaetae-1]|nr:MAG: hypothetical protein CVV44_06315 [Spirochaetae bacterium HGW-Spirochaetae-1]
MTESNITENKYTSYIMDGIVQRRSNRVFENIVRMLFRRTEFDGESLATLKDYEEKGKIVYVSFQSSTTSLLIFTYLLKRHGLKAPVLALGYNPYLFQVVTNLVRRIYRFLWGGLGLRSFRMVTDEEYIEDVLEKNDPMVISLLSGKLFVRRYVEIKMDILQHLIESQKKSSLPIYILPQIMFWNRNPEKTRTFVSSRATGDRGLWSGFFTVAKSATHPFMRISGPINLQEEIEAASVDDSNHIARIVRNKILEMYNHEKRTVLGPVMKSSSEMMERVLYHKNVLDEIQRQMEGGKSGEEKLRRKAYKYFREIAADFSIIYIRFFEKSLNYVFRKIFDGIHYNMDDFKMLREESQKGPLIIMPSHKSHMDYLIISSLLFQNKIIPPHILAGANLTFFPMGKIFRRSGAFFMRRSFKGLDLYAAVFKQYVKILVNEGYSIEFFIEGGRTRTGKLLVPKLGMLKYLIESVEEGYNKDIMLVPATINYDRILEESSYQKELKGKEKKEESTSSFVKSRSLLKRNYGKVHVSFSKPVSLNELKAAVGGGEDETYNVAMYVMRRINEITMVTPFAITTSAILFSSVRGISRLALYEKVGILHDFLAFAKVPMAEMLQNRDNIGPAVDMVLQSFKADGILGELKLEGIETLSKQAVMEDLFVINEEERIKICFYKNTIIHYILPVSFTAIAILRFSGKGSMSYEKVRKVYRAIIDLFNEEFIYPEVLIEGDGGIEAMVEYLAGRGIISRTNGKISIEGNGEEELLFYAYMVHDYFESYYVVFDTIIHLEREKISRKDLMADIRKNGIRHYHLGKVRLMESLSISNYNNALVSMAYSGIIKERTVGKKNIEVTIADKKKAVEVMENIRQYIERS